MDAYDILVRPVVTERASELTENFNQVTFVVAKDANKHQIRAAVEALYGVKVSKVATMIMPGKVKRRGMSIGKRPNWKKAIVTLKGDDMIDFFATE